jgi:oligogalacturonide lyase
VISTRRLFLSSLAGAGLCFGEGAPLVPSEIRRYADAATEFNVFRLTDPAHQSSLAAPHHRSVSRRGNFLLYASDRSGTMQAYQMDLKSGESRVLTDVAGFVPESLALSAVERNFYYAAGGSLFVGNLTTARAREAYRASSDLGRDFGFSEDGLYAGLIEQKNGKHQLRLVNLRTGAAATLAESNDPISDPLPRPRRSSMLYRRAGGEAWLVNLDRSQNRRLKLAAGTTGQAFWSADGRSIFYLNFPSDPKQLNNLREFTPDTGEDRLIAATSQFVSFNRNGDSSVFVGASGTRTAPYILLLVRSVKRELALCEHRASDPRLVTAIFSPSSQRVFFQSDRDGKMAIYTMPVDRLVEETETEGSDKP